MSFDRIPNLGDEKLTTTVAQLGEWNLIKKLISPMLSHKFGNVLLDDCALFDTGHSTLLFSVDQGPKQTFLEVLGIGIPQDIGHFVVTINVSDIAAMGGTPIGLLLALGLEGNEGVDYVKAFLQGIEQGMNDYGLELMGGDTKQVIGRSTTITIIGEAKEGKPLLRKGAQVGDQVFITPGQVGRCLREYIEAAKNMDNLVPSSVYRPKAEVEFGQFLCKSKLATSCIDMSDGLLRSAELLGEMNGLAVSLDVDGIPLALPPKEGRGVDWRNLILNVGGDFGLMFTTSMKDAPIAAREGAHRIGVITSGKEGVQKDTLQARGINISVWEHFKTVDSVIQELLSFV